MNDAITIRAACLADTAFLVDCNAAMALETEHKLLDREVLKQGTEAVFADAQRGFYRIAERAGVAVGCLLVTHEWSDWRNGDWWWIQSVYVTAEAPQSSFFRRLVASVRDGWQRLRGEEPQHPSLITMVVAPAGAQRLHHLFRSGTEILVLP